MVHYQRKNFFDGDLPKVSVILPTYNRAHLIGRAIESVLNQTYRDFELLIIDDGSIDDTEKVVKSFTDKRISFIKHERNKGAAAARNTGIHLARGEFIAFQDSDDEWLPEKLERQINKFGEVSADVGVVYCGYVAVSQQTNREIFRSIPMERGKIYPRILQGCITGTFTPLIKRVCFDKAGFFDEILPTCQDWDMWIRISRYYEFDFIPDVLVRIYIHGSQISTDLAAKIKGKEKILEKYRLELAKNPSSLHSFLMGLFLQNGIAGNVRQGRKHLIDALKLEPLQIKGYIHLLFSLCVPWIYRTILKSYYIKSIDGIMYYLT
jgi:glycosyltransferase involved in cell wall biosynthesis